MSPVAASDPYIHSDGMLSYAAAVETLGFDGVQELSASDGPQHFPDVMPLDRYRGGPQDEWVWAASSARVALPDRGDDRGVGEWNVARWRKRFDKRFEHRKKDTQVTVSTGPYKSYNAALPYSPTNRLLFFFEGDPDQVVQLIERHVPAVGKKTSIGYGQIRDVAVTEVSGEVESAIVTDGTTLRSLPAGFVDGTPIGARIERRTVWPPYWHSKNQTMAYPPFQDLDGNDLQEAIDCG